MGNNAPVALLRNALVVNAADRQAVLICFRTIDGNIVNDGAFRLFVLPGVGNQVLAVGLRDGHAGAGVVVQFLINGLEHARFPEKIRQVLSGGVAGVLHERKLELAVLLAPGIHLDGLIKDIRIKVGITLPGYLEIQLKLPQGGQLDKMVVHHRTVIPAGTLVRPALDKPVFPLQNAVVQIGVEASTNHVAVPAVDAFMLQAHAGGIQHVIHVSGVNVIGHFSGGDPFHGGAHLVDVAELMGNPPGAAGNPVRIADLLHGAVMKGGPRAVRMHEPVPDHTAEHAVFGQHPVLVQAHDLLLHADNPVVQGNKLLPLVRTELFKFLHRIHQMHAAAHDVHNFRGGVFQHLLPVAVFADTTHENSVHLAGQNG